MSLTGFLKLITIFLSDPVGFYNPYVEVVEDSECDDKSSFGFNILYDSLGLNSYEDEDEEDEDEDEDEDEEDSECSFVLDIIVEFSSF